MRHEDRVVFGACASWTKDGAMLCELVWMSLGFGTQGVYAGGLSLWPQYQISEIMLLLGTYDYYTKAHGLLDIRLALLRVSLNHPPVRRDYSHIIIMRDIKLAPQMLRSHQRDQDHISKHTPHEDANHLPILI